VEECVPIWSIRKNIEKKHNQQTQKKHVLYALLLILFINKLRLSLHDVILISVSHDILRAPRVSVEPEFLRKNFVKITRPQIDAHKRLRFDKQLVIQFKFSTPSRRGAAFRLIRRARWNLFHAPAAVIRMHL